MQQPLASYSLLEAAWMSMVERVIVCSLLLRIGNNKKSGAQNLTE
jgi:hypothetical protein